MTNAIVGQEDHLIAYLVQAIDRAQRIHFNVAFLLESGAKLIAPHLQRAAGRGAGINILTGRYMNVTEPSAIYYLLDALGERLDIRFYADNLTSFHPKAYIFEYGDEAEIFVGSSNLSRLALTCGLEWNYHFLRSEDPESYDKFARTFNHLFHNYGQKITDDVLRTYAAGWKKPAWAKTEEGLVARQTEEGSRISPRGAQIEALYELKRAREEGIEKGLVIAATGVGKTYLAAFDSLPFERILFLAHREEILRQAEESFKKAKPGVRTGFVMGGLKEYEADAVFATVQTLAREDNLTQFDRGFFDYLVVDEFHHAAADSYRKVLSYFKPKFTLGLTATPYRTDNRDIYQVCEDNVIYEIHLKEAINRDLLVPFRYYGILMLPTTPRLRIETGNMWWKT